jgi:hypothetical protein
MLVPGAAAAQHVGLPDMEPGAPGPFALADVGRVEHPLASARFHDVSVESIARPMHAGSDVDDKVAFFESTDIARRLMADAPPGKIAAALDAIRDALVPYARRRSRAERNSLARDRAQALNHRAPVS